jgi:hypothetical protein
MACDSCAGALYTGVSVLGIYDDVTGCPLITVSGSPAVASINANIVNTVDVAITNVPEFTVSGVDTTCIGSSGSPELAQLGSAAQYAILAYSGITNSGSSVVSGGNIGSYPTNSVTGFPPGVLVAPAAYVTASAGDQTAVAAAITYYQGLGPGTALTTADMGTQMSAGAPVGTYYAGVYSSASSLQIDTPITLDAQGNPNAVFVFLADSTIIQQIAGTINLINGANACNVIWVAGSSWTSIGPGALTQGTILAVASITLGGGSLNGRALANTGAVTIASAETITVPDCAGSGACGLDVYLLNSCISVCGQSFTEVGSPAVSSLNTYITGGTLDVTLTENTPSTPIYVCQGTCATPFTINLTEVGGSPIGVTSAGSPAENGLNVYLVGGAVCASQCGTWDVNAVVTNTVTITGTGAGGAVTVAGTVTVTNTISTPLYVDVTNSCISVCGQTFTNVGSPAESSLNVFVTGGAVTLTSNTPTTPIYVDVTNFSACVDVCGATFSVLGSPAESYLNVNVASSPSTPVYVDVTGGSVTVTGTVSVTGTVTVTNTPSTPVYVCQGTCASPFTINLTDISGVPVGFTLTGSPATAALDVYVVNGLSVDVAMVTCAPQTYTVGATEVLSLAPDGALIVVPADEQFACSIQYYSYDSGTTFVEAMTAAFTPLWSIQGNGTAAYVQLLREMEVFTDGSTVQFQLIEGGALTGAAFAAGPGNVNVDTSATGVTGGIVVWSGYVAAVPRNFDNMLDCLNGKTYTIAAKSFKGCAKVVAQVRWSEQASICG